MRAMSVLFYSDPFSPNPIPFEQAVHEDFPVYPYTDVETFVNQQAVTLHAQPVDLIMSENGHKNEAILANGSH